MGGRGVIYSHNKEAKVAQLYLLGGAELHGLLRLAVSSVQCLLQRDNLFDMRLELLFTGVALCVPTSIVCKALHNTTKHKIERKETTDTVVGMQRVRRGMH